MIRVLLVDDQPLIRSGFRALLDLEDDIEVVAEAADGAKCLALVKEHLPDVALVDIQMPVMDGIEATRRIAADPDLAGVHVVMLTNYGMDEYVFDALRGRRHAASWSRTSCRKTSCTPYASPPAVTPSSPQPSPAHSSTATSPSRRPPPPPHGLEQLTDRERETVALAAHGLSNDEIARRLVISPATAKTHINRAMTKLHARDRAQLVVYAYQSGLVTPRGA